jgi:hypothetical protein
MPEGRLDTLDLIGLMMRQLLRNIFRKKVTPKEILTSEMLAELRSLRLQESKLLEQIRRLREEKELANNRHKVYAEHIKGVMISVLKKKLTEIHRQGTIQKKAA